MSKKIPIQPSADHEIECPYRIAMMRVMRAFVMSWQVMLMGDEGYAAGGYKNCIKQAQDHPLTLSAICLVYI